MAEWIGFLAAILNTVCYVPQALHMIRSRNTQGVSLLSYLTLFSGVALWLTYGILIHNMPIMLANGISLPLIFVVIFMKMRHKYTLAIQRRQLVIVHE